MSSLKMMAMDEEDLSVLSAYCQDALFKSGDITWLAAEKRFLISLNRFVWEKAQLRSRLFGLFGKKSYERHNAILHFEHVDKVRTLDVNPDDKDTVYALLAIEFMPNKDDVSGSIELTLAGGHSILLDVDCIEARLADLDAAWETGSKPKHPLS